ncbi:MAG: molybdopterin-guanine dinucleotide biosynthesis protein B, partial [Butyrivibrio sp.]|nr:molybdopterin-guanine dinucleotide biosynthesis protein B [Butyrivibrio sp.]
RLINEFINDGLSVGVIKHDGHDFECDIRGTDSYRFYDAGAAGVAVFSGTHAFVHKRQTVTIRELIMQMQEYDIVIIEGLKDSEYPKVEVVRSAVSSKGVCNPDTLICIATDSKDLGISNCPVYGLDDVHEVFCCIKRFLNINTK